MTEGGRQAVVGEREAMFRELECQAVTFTPGRDGMVSGSWERGLVRFTANTCNNINLKVSMWQQVSKC